MSTLEMKSIQKELIAEGSQAKAFKFFTEQMDLWWPRKMHIGNSPMIELVLEPGRNGRWYSRHDDGSKENVGHVLEWEPNKRLVLAWQIDGHFKYDPNLITEVEVQFIPDGPKHTKVRFAHRNLDLLGGEHAMEGMEKGWDEILDLYKIKIKEI